MKAIVIPNGFVDSWMVIVQNAKAETIDILATGLTRAASQGVADKWNGSEVIDGTWEQCSACDGRGTSEDPCDWDGRCVYCRGTGDVFVPYPDDDSDWEDE